MTMQTDVKAKTLTATGALSIGSTRARIKGVYYVPSGTAGSISLKDGGSGGTEKLLLATPATTAGTGAMTVVIPGQGVLFEADPYLTLSNVTSVTFFYG